MKGASSIFTVSHKGQGFFVKRTSSGRSQPPTCLDGGDGDGYSDKTCKDVLQHQCHFTFSNCEISYTCIQKQMVDTNSYVSNMQNVQYVTIPRPLKWNEKSLQHSLQLIYCTEVSLVFTIIPEHTETSVPSRKKFENSVTVAVGSLHSQQLTNSHFHFHTILKSATSWTNEPVVQNFPEMTTAAIHIRHALHGVAIRSSRTTLHNK